MITPYYRSMNGDFTLIMGDSLSILGSFDFKFDMIFADPPYFLSNGGISVSNGKIVCVDKGDWDKSPSEDYIHEFNLKWLSACRDKLKDNGTIWVSGFHHNIFSVASQLSLLGFKILNVVTWNKTNPPHSLSHRMLTYSAEFIIWAKKSKRSHHKYNYEVMRNLNNGREMTDVWRLSSVAQWEKTCGKHPTQKPLGLLTRIVLASTKEGDWILDPFNGSGTTGIAASLFGRKYLGIDKEQQYLDISIKRRQELDDVDIRIKYQERLLKSYKDTTKEENSLLVLIGRIGSEEQWKWFEQSRIYILPMSKVLSMPKLIGVEYVLAFFAKKPKQVMLCKLKSPPQVKTREQVEAMASRYSVYKPTRDDTYWVFRLSMSLKELNGKAFKKNLLLSKNEERGAYWIKYYDDVVKSFE